MCTPMLNDFCFLLVVCEKARRNVYGIITHTQTISRLYVHRQTKIIQAQQSRQKRRDDIFILYFRVFIWSLFVCFCTSRHLSFGPERVRTHTIYCCSCFILVLIKFSICCLSRFHHCQLAYDPSGANETIECLACVYWLIYCQFNSAECFDCNGCANKSSCHVEMAPLMFRAKFHLLNQ